MLVRSAIIKLIAFGIIAVLGIGYTWYEYGGGKTVLPGSIYTVKLRLANGGGIFTNAEVAYRGVNVGKVGDMHLTKDGVEVDLHIRSSAPPIPADVHAAIRDLSAVGEQYVDLQPRGASGPTLAQLPADKRVIGQNDTSIPPPPQKLINNLDSLARSVPEKSLRTVVDELDAGFSGTGSDLQRLLDTASAFTKAAQRNLPQTTRLLDASRTVLDTQNDEAAALRSFSGNLQKLAATLKSSDPDIRHVIESAAPAAASVDTVLRESGSNLSVLIANLLTTSNLLRTRLHGLELALVVYPTIPAAIPSVTHGNGQAHLGLALNFFNPPPCVRGYQGTHRRPGTDTVPQQPNYQAYCAEPTGSPIDVRGSQNAPFAGVPAQAKAPSPGDSGGGSAGSKSAHSAGLGSNGMFGLPPLGPRNLSGLLGVTG